MTHFLQPLLRAPGRAYGLWNQRTDRWLATRVVSAFDSRARRRGLLGRSELEAGTALILAPCWAVHTAFMRFPLDLAFVGRHGRIMGISRSVKPWRVRAVAGAFAVVELPGGNLDAATSRGDAVEVRTIVRAEPDFDPPEIQ